MAGRAGLVAGALALAACGGVGPLRPPTPPVVVEASLDPGVYRVGAAHAVGAALVNRSTRRVVKYGHLLVGLRLDRDPEFSLEERRAVRARGDTVTTWSRSYTLAYDWSEATTLELPLTYIEPNSRLTFPLTRFRWPEDPGRYVAYVCTSYAASEEGESQEVCAPPVAVEIR